MLKRRRRLATGRPPALASLQTIRRPLILLAALSLVSLGARAAWLGDPCRAPCRVASDHVLVFDEVYYVNAARRIAGVAVPRGEPYATAPAGADPNSEHPQLAKLVVAGSIEAFGDGPFAWRLGSLICGSLAILGMFALVRAAGGGEGLALGAATLMALDNLLLVHGRIATLDVYVVAAIVWAAVLYLRGAWLGAGALIGIGASIKLVAPYVLVVLAVLEGLRLLTAHSREGARAGFTRLFACGLTAAGVFVAVLALLDAVASPYDQNRHARIAGGPLAHVEHMLSFAAGQVSRHGPTGIASYPWQWFGDYKPIVYLNIDPGHPTHALAGIHPQVHFLGVISPPILLLALPALIAAGVRVRRSASDIDKLALAWCAGTMVPFELLSLLYGRTSYLYYMVVVMPGVYVAVARLVHHQRSHRRVIGAWAIAVVLAAVVMYPFTPLPW